MPKNQPTFNSDRTKDLAADVTSVVAGVHTVGESTVAPSGGVPVSHRVAGNTRPAGRQTDMSVLNK